MMFIFAKLKLYAALVASTVLAVVLVYYRGRSDKKTEMEYQLKDERLKNILRAKEVQDEVQELSDDTISDRASKWVRPRRNK